MNGGSKKEGGPSALARRGPARDILVFLFFLGLGAAAELLGREIVPGSSIYFGSFPPLIVAARLGPLPGLVLALLLNLPRLGNLEGLCLLLVLLLEALVVGLARRGDERRNLLGIDCLYWPLMGAPLLALLAGLLLRPSPPVLLVIVANAWFNGLVNATLAALAADSPLVDALLRRPPALPRSIAEYIKVGTSVAVLPISILGLLIGLSAYRHLSEHQLADHIGARLEEAARSPALALLAGSGGSKGSVGSKGSGGSDGYGRYEPASVPPPPGAMPWQEGLFQSRPSGKASETEAWMHSVYFGEAGSGEGRVRYLVPAARAFDELLRVYAVQLLLRLAYFYASYLVALLLSRALTSRFTHLAKAARGLPDRIEAGEEPSWPEEDFAEFHSISRNFKEVSERLHALFGDLRDSRDGLGRLVSRRTEEMGRLNAELRGLLARIEGDREAERARVARELHDEFGQSLASLGMSLYLLEKRLRGGDERGRELLAESRELIENLSTSMKRLVAGLRPGVLDRMGLPAAIESLAASYAQDEGRRLEFERSLPEDFAPPGELSTAIYRVAQESLVNAIRHSGSERIALRLASDGQATILQVRDWGKGFDPELQAGEPGPSFGLIGMRERCLALGGELEILSKEGEGTLVTATFKTGEDDAHQHTRGR